VGSKSEEEGVSELLEARVRILEQQVEFLLKLNGLNISEFRSVDDSTLLSVYRDAVQLLGLSEQRIDLEIIENWSNVFLQLSEIEMIRLQPIVELKHTWEPFYLLCLRMMTFVRTHPKIDVSVRTQHLYAALEKGIRGLRAIGAIMLKRNPDTIPRKAQVLLEPDDLKMHLKK